MKSFVFAVFVTFSCIVWQVTASSTAVPTTGHDTSPTEEATTEASPSEAPGNTTAAPTSTAVPSDVTSGNTTAAPPSTAVPSTAADDSSTAAATTVAPPDTTPDAGTSAAPVGTTQSPADTTTASSGGDCSGRHFDGASFAGGIVLAAGLAGMAFLGCKFYQSRSETTYHQF